MRTLTNLMMVISCLFLLPTMGCGVSNHDPAENATVNTATSNGGGVAIIDLDAVAKTFGCDKQMSTSLHQREAKLKEQLATIKASYAEQIAEKKQQFGANPTPEQLRTLAAIEQQANASLSKVRQQAKSNLNQHGSLLIQSFRSQVQPIAREVARKKGLSVIVTKNDSVIFDYDTTVDITAGVIERLLAMQAEKTSPSSPSHVTPDTPATEQTSPDQNPSSNTGVTAARPGHQVR